MLRKVESTSDVNRGPEPCQSGTALTFPVLCLAYTRVVSQIDGAVRAYAHAHDDHYLTRSKFNSLLTEMITPQTYKTASCTSCIRGSLRLAPNYRDPLVCLRTPRVRARMRLHGCILVVMKIICAGRAFAKVTRFL